MRRIARDDVTKAVGQADDVTVARIIATGATVDELAEYRCQAHYPANRRPGSRC